MLASQSSHEAVRPGMKDWPSSMKPAKAAHPASSQRARHNPSDS